MINNKNIIKELETKIPKKESLKDYSWNKISQICEQGYADIHFTVGDEKQVRLYTGEKITCVLIGKNHDTINGTVKKCGATFAFRIEGLYEPICDGWEYTKIRDCYLPRIFKLLPSSLRKCIKIVNKSTSSGGCFPKIIETKDSLFLMSEIELTGKHHYSLEGEGNQYELFANCDEIDILKGEFWLRSPSTPDVNCYAVGLNTCILTKPTHCYSSLVICFCI